MAEKLNPRETVSFKDLLISNMIEVQALAFGANRNGPTFANEKYPTGPQVRTHSFAAQPPNLRHFALIT